MRTLAIFATVAGLMAQTKFSNVQIIPQTTAANGTGALSFLELRANGVHKFTWKAPDALAADVTLKWPTDGAAGFLYSDGAGNTNWTGAGTCGVDCQTLSTNQTVTGIKTHQNGIILQGTSTSQTFNVTGNYNLNVGTIGGNSVNSWVTGFNSAITTWNDAAGVTRVQIEDGGALTSNVGLVRVSDNANVFVAEMSHLGFDTDREYRSGGNIVINSSQAGFLSALTLNTGAAVVGYCWIATSVGGAGDWQSCGAGGSYVTTNTAQTGLTGTKEWNDAHTYKASILSGTADVINIGDPASAFGNIYSLNMQPVNLELANSARSVFWRMDLPTSNSFGLWSGSGTQEELQIDVYGSTDTRWLMRGSLYPVSTTGGNGDIGGTGTKWRSGYFSDTLSTQFLVATSNVSVGTTSRTQITSTTLVGFDSTITNAKVLMSWAGSGSGIIRTYSNAGGEENSIDGTDGVRSNVGFSVGTLASPLRVVDNAGNAVFPTLQITTGPAAGYVLTSDASGNATWQASAGGSFVTTNTNQSSLSGTKQWTNTHTFDGGVAVKLNSTARNWYPETDAAYDLGADGSLLPRWQNIYASTLLQVGTAGGARVESTGSAITSWYNASNTQKVLVSSGGTGPSSSGIVRVYNNTATVVNGSMDNTGINTEVGYSIGGTQVIDQFRSVTANGFTAASGTFTGNLTVLGTCTGCSSGWTTNTTQTGLSGDKTTSGALNLQASFGGITRIAIGGTAGTLTGYSTGGAVRAFMSSASGVFSTHTGSAGSETMVIQLTNSGVNLNNFAQAGQTTSVTTGGCTMNFTYGWLTSKSGC